MTAMPNLIAYWDAVADELHAQAVEFKTLASAAARAEVAYRRAKSKRRYRAKVTDGIRSVAEADLVTEADDEVLDLMEARNLSQALVDAARTMINVQRERLEFGRTCISAEKASDRQASMQYRP